MTSNDDPRSASPDRAPIPRASQAVSGRDEAASVRPDDTPTPSSQLPVVGFVGLLLLVLIVAEGQVLPRIEGSAEPALISTGPWSWPPLDPLTAASTAPALPVALGIALLAGLGLLYAISLVLLRAEPIRARALVFVLLVTALLTLATVASLPTRKADLFYYAFQGRLIARARLNPYLQPPRALAADAWFPFVSPVWRDLPTGYGPVWLLLSAGVDLVADRGDTLDSFVQTILALRALFAGLTVVNTLLIWLILADLAPSRRLIGAIAYAWNPVVLLAGFEHNDTVTLFFALLGLWLHLRGRPTPAAAALTLSALVKYFTAPLLIGYLIWHWRTEQGGARSQLLPLLAPPVLAVLATWPFDPRAVVTHFPTYLEESGRIAHLVQLPFDLLVILVVGTAARVVLVQPSDRLRRVVENGTLALFVYLAFLSRDWFPWYLTTVVGLSALLGGWWLGVAATAGTFWLLGSNQGTAYVAALAQQAFGLHPPTVIALAAFGPPCIVAAESALWRWKRRPRRWLIVGSLILVAGCVAATEIPLLERWPSAPPEATLTGGRPPGPVVIGTTLEWDDWSWETRVNQIGTPAGPDGPRSLCLTFAEPAGAFFAHHPGFSTSAYRAVTVDLGPPNPGNPSLLLAVRGSAGQTLGVVPLDAYAASTSSIDGWRRIRVPLSALGASDTSVTGVLLQSGPGSVGKTVCVQDLAFR